MKNRDIDADRACLVLGVCCKLVKAIFWAFVDLPNSERELVGGQWNPLATYL